MGTFTPELTFGPYAYGAMSEAPGILYKTLQQASSTPPSSEFSAASASGSLYAVPYTVLDSSSSSYTVLSAVLTAAGASYSPI